MLVLTRKLNQQIRLGDDVTITVLRVKGNSIRLGIEAPRETRVVRGELELFAEPETVASKDEPTPAATHNFESTVKGMRFPQTIDREVVEATDSRPLKSFMPASMREVVSNISI